MNKPLRVLIVEDSEDDALLLARQLRRGGYAPEYRRVDTEAAMMSALEEEIWDIVISDYAMPGFSALGALDTVRRQGLDLPCLIVSGTIGEETAVNTMKAGASDYIMKDNLQRLVPAIERELREAEVRRERRRAEEALRESEQRYRSLVDNIDIGVTLIDRDYNVVMTNSAQGRLFGKPVAEIVGRKCYEAFEGLQDVCYHCPAVQAISTGQPIEVETERSLREGGHSSVRIRAFPIFGNHSGVTGCIEVVEDITERKQLEQLRQAAQLEAIGRLAGGVAHDFNNLLTAMIGYSGVLLNQMPKNNSFREKVFEINRAAERAAELTRQLLAFSRKQVLTVKVLDLNSIIVDFEKILCRLIGKDTEIQTEFEPALSRISADPSQIEQILLNLVVNARDAMPSGGMLSMETANVYLDKEYARIHAEVRPGWYVMLSVTDNGIGMDEKTRANIFDPFFTTKEIGKGTGLGLSTVYGIVKQHQGHVSVSTEPGRGSTFKVYFPAVQDDLAEAPEVPRAAVRSEGDETVLIVEDEEIVRKLALDVLQMLGYKVLVASNPEQAIRMSQQHDGPIELLLTDVALPKMDGTSLFRVLSPDRKEMKVLYVSGYTQDSIVEHGVLRPGVHFLQKPFTVDRLAAKVREVLDES